MEKVCYLWFSVFVVVCLASTSRFCHCSDQERQVYIIYMGALPEGEYSPSSHHVNMLQEAIGPKYGSQHFVRSYKKSFNGFAAYLTDEEREKLSSTEGVVSVFPNRIRQPLTTRSWDYIGFRETSPRNPATEGDVILGVIDTGIWPESESFSDEGLGPVPSKWKGACEGGKNFTCNKKIIGARWYSFFGGEDSARDIMGHGSHTASTVAGKNVKSMSFYGLAEGVVRGAVPSARIAAYKVCQPNIGCHDSDILAAFDDAIADGVDIISLSIGGASAAEFYADAIAIGAFHAMKRDILTVQAAGNDGLIGVPTSSVAPWTFTVAASSTDRRIVNKVVLGNGTAFVGSSVDTFNMTGGKYPLVYGKDATTTRCNEYNARKCEPGCLDSSKVKGKIVVCDAYKGIKEAHSAGALGSIAPSREDDCSFTVPFPAAALSDMRPLRDYMSSTETPMADISMSEVIQYPDAPIVARFSSRGPNVILSDILKPDISAPGIEILAAFSPLASLASDPLDTRSVKYSILSGTSMACPHVAGAAAYVKSFHPDWSSSAIKSALMTTARDMNATKKYGDTEFSYGAGHIDPVKAVNPGLVYEINLEEYGKLLCSLDYDAGDLAKIFGRNFTCPQEGGKMSAKDLNYPAMTARVKETVDLKFKRTVTNVGLAKSTYKATIIPNSHVNITVEPNVLSFESLNERKSFAVTLSGTLSGPGIVSAALIWSDGTHIVRSPIVVY